MPELPEIETIKRQLLKYLPEQKLLKFEIKDFSFFNNTFSGYELAGQKVKNLIRKGKWLFFLFERNVLAFHLGLTGKLLLNSNIFSHVICVLFFEKCSLSFYDLRKFGKVKVFDYKEWKEFLNSFGKDALEYGKLKGELIAKEKKLEILNQNKKITLEEIGKLKEEIKSLKKRLQGLQGRLNYVSLPEYQLNLRKLQSQMSIAQGLFETFVKEYEMAKAQEMKEQISFQVIDPPYVPRRPYKPKKKLIVAVALVSGLFLGIFAAFFREWLDNVKKRHREEKNNA